MIETGMKQGIVYLLKNESEGNIFRPNHIFINWNSQADGNGITYMPGDMVILYADLILYAQWRPL